MNKENCALKLVDEIILLQMSQIVHANLLYFRNVSLRNLSISVLIYFYLKKY